MNCSPPPLAPGCELRVHVDDLVDLILRIFQANGHNEQHHNIKEWFCGEEMIDFWSFFSQLTEKYVGLLQVHVVQETHTKVVSELLKEGKLEKKGHVVHNWKSRWFVLTASLLSYFESHENLILKVKIFSVECWTFVQMSVTHKASKASACHLNTIVMVSSALCVCCSVKLRRLL